MYLVLRFKESLAGLNAEYTWQILRHIAHAYANDMQFHSSAHSKSNRDSPFFAVFRRTEAKFVLFLIFGIKHGGRIYRKFTQDICFVKKGMVISMTDTNSVAPYEYVIKTRENDVCDGIRVRYTLYAEITDKITEYSVRAETADETAVASRVTCDISKAFRIFDMLHGGGVTPCCLLEIAEDIIEVLL